MKLRLRAAQVAPVLQRVVEAHGCTLVEGVLSHQLKQFVIDGNKCILNKVSPPAALPSDKQLVCCRKHLFVASINFVCHGCESRGKLELYVGLQLAVHHAGCWGAGDV